MNLSDWKGNHKVNLGRINTEFKSIKAQAKSQNTRIL